MSCKGCGIKGKVVPQLKSAPRHEDLLGQWRYNFPHFKLGLGWRWVVSFTLQPHNLQRKAHCTNWIGGCLSLGVGLDVAARRINSHLCRESNSDHRTFSTVSVL